MWIFSFYILLYYFIKVIIKTFYISSFIVVYIIYFTHKKKYMKKTFPFSWKMTLCEKWHFGCKKCIFSHSFWPRWLKQTSFYRDLNYLHSIAFSFFVFHLFPTKKNIQNKQIIAWKQNLEKKNQIFFFI